jgi:hypothetical protein
VAPDADLHHPAKRFGERLVVLLRRAVEIVFTAGDGAQNQWRQDNGKEQWFHAP